MLCINHGSCLFPLFAATLFSTDTYNTRIHAYENDLLYAYSIANIYGEGQRVYAIIQPYGLARYLDQIWSGPGFIQTAILLAAEMKPLKETEGRTSPAGSFKW